MSPFVRLSRPLLLPLKLVALVLFVFGTNQGLEERLRAVGSPAGYLVFGAIWMCSLVAIVYVAFYSGWFARLVWTAILVQSAIVGASFWAINERWMGLLDGEKLLSLVAFIDNVVQFYGPLLVRPIAYSLLGIAAINLPPVGQQAPVARALGRSLPLLPLLPVLVVCGILYKKGGEGTNGLAVQHTAPAYLIVLAFERLTAGPPPQRQPVRLSHDGSRPLRNLVVVMDESVRGDLLDLNRPDGAPTGLLGREDAVSFGVMPSMANCSDTTNVAFRYGIGRKDYLQQLAQNPSLWSYAKHAGYRTYYLDAQRTGGGLQNGMDAAELRDIDRHVQIAADVAPAERDLELARALRRILDDPAAQPSFVYVNKMGAHFPYEGKYPTGQGPYGPVMRRQYFGKEADPGGEWKKFTTESSGGTRSSELRARFRNSYLNAVSWNTRRFFEILLAGLSLEDTLILYTSDHGQDLHEDGRPGFSTHCTLGPAPANEARVPLVALTRHPDTAAALRAAAAVNRDRLSQFNLIPSLLRWMGYPRAQMVNDPRFEPGIEDAMPADNQRFLSTFFTRFAGKPVWNSSVVVEAGRAAR